MWHAGWQELGVWQSVGRAPGLRRNILGRAIEDLVVRIVVDFSLEIELALLVRDYDELGARGFLGAETRNEFFGQLRLCFVRSVEELLVVSSELVADG